MMLLSSFGLTTRKLKGVHFLVCLLHVMLRGHAVSWLFVSAVSMGCADMSVLIAYVKGPKVRGPLS